MKTIYALSLFLSPQIYTFFYTQQKTDASFYRRAGFGFYGDVSGNVSTLGIISLHSVSCSLRSEV